MMRRFKGSGKNAVLAAACVLLILGAAVLAVLCVRAGRNLRAALDERDRLESRATALSSELEQTKQQSAEDLTSRDQTIDSLEEVLNRLYAEHEDLSGERDGLLDENGTLTDRLDEAQEAAESLRESIDVLSRRIEAKREGTTVLRERTQELQDTVDELEGQLTDARDALDDNRSELKDTKKNLMLTQSELTATQKTLDAAQEELDSAKEELDSAKEELDSTKGQLRDAKDAIAALEEVVRSAEAAKGSESQSWTVEESAPPVQGAAPPVSYDGLSPEAAAVLRYIESSAPVRTHGNLSKTPGVTAPGNVAYYSCSMEGGEPLCYNADAVFYSASLIKAPYLYAVIREIEAYEAAAPRDADGHIVYGAGEKKYDLDELWTYDPATMFAPGSGEIQTQPKGFTLTWRELVEYALLYSDNVAFSQLYGRFGFTSFYRAVGELGIQGQAYGFMYLTARDCGKFCGAIWRYFETGTPYALWMKDLMTRSRYGEMIAIHYEDGTVAHKYGWDVDAFHDMAIVSDGHPHVIVILSDYAEGNSDAFGFFATVAGLTKAVYEK